MSKNENNVVRMARRAARAYARNGFDRGEFAAYVRDQRISANAARRLVELAAPRGQMGRRAYRAMVLARMSACCA